MVDDLPETGVEAKREVEARNGLDEIGRDAQHARRQVRLPGEEQDVREDALEGLLRLEGIDRVPAAMMKKVDARQRGSAILARSSKVAPERRPMTACVLVRHPHDGELVAQQRRVLGEPRDCGLPAT